PLQPNHSPPICLSAASTPTARPPGAVPRRGSEIRLDTQTSRFMAVPPTCRSRGGSAPQDRRSSEQALQPLAHGGRIRQPATALLRLRADEDRMAREALDELEAIEIGHVVPDEHWQAAGIGRLLHEAFYGRALARGTALD